ncbi:MAG: D-alanyl-D-alanine carboxypeptidase [Bacilli bacterium]|jgi:D-alanyl-D-alanine carboxypeptidase (penicillin-binding protein 5/6)|nr:D-alanyl-D-alanine carboxypeptidase [Bacilli bacterium]
MKKIIVFLVVFIIFPIKVLALSATNCVVMDLNSGRVLYNLNGDEARLIASITKIMTCLIAINYSDLDKIVVVDEDILKAYGSSVYLSVGEEIKLIDLLYGLMLRSGNDAAVAIANTVAGSMENFVYLMNEYASTIGMKNTHFVNSHGLDNNGVGNKSSAYDMALLTKVAMQNDTFRSIFGSRNYKASSNLKDYVWAGKNKLFSMYEYTTGGKTGYTMAAHKTLVTTASKENKNLVVVTLNDSNDFVDHKNLYEKYFKEYEAVLALDKNNFKVDNNQYKNTELYIKKEYYALVKENEKNDLKVNINLYKYDNVYNDMKIGEAKVLLKDEVLHTESIYLKKIEEKQLKKEKKSLWQRIIGWFKKW